MAVPGAQASLMSLIVFSFCLLTCANSLRYNTQNEHSALQLHARDNQTLSNVAITTPDSFACNFTQEFIVKATQANCSAHLDSLESSSAFFPLERWDSSKRFSNCTFHQITSRFAKVPDGIPKLIFRDGGLVSTREPNMEDAQLYNPPPPLESVLKVEEKTAPFLPIFKEATSPFFDLLTQTQNASYCTTNNTPSDDASPSLLLRSLSVATQQYARCAIQSPSTLSACTVSATSKLLQLPSAFFIYFGAPQCDSQLYSFLSVALSILLDALHTAVMLYLRPDAGSFSWLQFLIKLASGLGEPAIQASILTRLNGEESSGWVMAAMEFLQPTAAPLMAFVAGWWVSKGLGFQVLATDAMTTLVGVVMILGFTAFQVAMMAVAYFGLVDGGWRLAVGLLLAVGPWVLVYLLLGVIAISMELGFLFGLLEIYTVRTGYGFAVGFACLGILAAVLVFVVLTPVWAIWELGWKAREVRREGRAKLLVEKTEDGEKPLFPLARFFRQRLQNTSRLKRGLIKFVFWLFVFLSFASFVGKWMFMVGILSFAGDAYCPSGYKESTFAGLGFKTVILSTSVALQYLGVTA
ncbi:hypothetical protein B0H67DRAFT_683589 [Lasiosphaeris hirsuta]|uniref:Uncharacterized protein n=1 Tax=Lasiosphaeris hirsuta TaxID=260670 RepID=A0AA40DVS8_9PEZI|nr:hypothetical protein B0H67DRAFT_683589 [Lasiosphaeris hirsuta]